MPALKDSKKSGGLKQGPNRRTAVYVTLGLVGAIAFAFLFSVILAAPGTKRQAAAKAAKQKQLTDLKAGNAAAANSAIDQRLQQIAASAPQDQPEKTAKTQGASASAAGHSVPDQVTLAELAAAYQASRKPHHGQGVDIQQSAQSLVTSFRNEASGSNKRDSANGIFEAYPKPKMQAVAAITGTTDNKDQEATYNALKPLKAPSNHLLSQGSIIRAVLVTGIDTRNAGSVAARVTQDVYSSIKPGLVLIPAGSRLVGTYSRQVSPGLPRIPVTFSRVILPDGQALKLGKMDAINYQGASGIPGDYHSNLLRALGPSLLVTLIGTAVDRESGNNDRVVSGGGTTQQAPSVAEQIAPQVNSQIMSRYSAAKPYFTVPAGTAFKIATSRDIVVPNPDAPPPSDPSSQTAGMSSDTSTWQNPS